MAFFDDFGRKLSSKGQTGVRKARDMSASAHINSAIAQENKIIDDNYYQIGKLYYAIHAEDCEADFSGMVSVIREAERRIADYQQQIQSIRGTVKCPNCAASVPSAAFCICCGLPLSEVTGTAAGDTVRCNFCGNTVALGSRFCTHCGKPLSSGASPVQPAAVCAKCSAQLAPGAAFCTGCGAPVGSSPNPPEIVEPTIGTPDDTIESQEKRCLNCGAEIEPEAAFCTECGTPVTFEDVQSGSDPDEQDEEFVVQCSNCGEAIEPGASFCTCSGIHIGDDGRAEEPDFKVCVKCGAPADKQDVFCTECGARF